MEIHGGWLGGDSRWWRQFLLWVHGLFSSFLSRGLTIYINTTHVHNKKIEIDAYTKSFISIAAFSVIFTLYHIYDICFPFLNSSSQSHLRSWRYILTKSGWFAMYDSNVSIFVTISLLKMTKTWNWKYAKQVSSATV